MIRRLACAVGLTILVGLPSGWVPVQLSESQLIGTWRVAWQCGTETLVLKPDSSYVQTIDFEAGGTASNGGRWRAEQGRVVLQDALEYCSVSGVKLQRPARRERSLNTEWEWGRVILSFNPDIQGFERR